MQQLSTSTLSEMYWKRLLCCSDWHRVLKRQDPNMAENSRIYLDHNATTPLAEKSRSAIVSNLEHFGNPSSIHWQGRGPKQILRESRTHLAEGLVCHPLELVFTSGGSESNNLVIAGLYRWQLDKIRDVTNKNVTQILRNEWITSTVEHPSVLKTFRWLESMGETVHYISVDRKGQLDWQQFLSALSERTLLVSIMTANNETGTLFPIKEIAAEAHKVGALVHTDAVQALGKIPISLKDWNVDYASFSAHKFYALKGTGVTYFKKGAPTFPLILGGGQERHRRAGTENVLGIAALGAMARELSKVEMKAQELNRLRNYFESRVTERISGIRWTALESPRICNTSHVVIEGVDGESLLMNLDILGFAVSTGAACSSGNPEPSPVLLAMGLSRAEAQSSLRVTLGWETTIQEINLFLEALEKVTLHLRSLKARDLRSPSNFQEASL